MKDSDWHQQPRLETLIEAPSDTSTIEEDSPVSLRNVIELPSLASHQRLSWSEPPAPPPAAATAKRPYLKWLFVLFVCDQCLGSFTLWFRRFTDKDSPAGMKHGSVVYYSSVPEEVDGEVLYQRDITAPCGWGILIVTIGPADAKDPYSFDLYATEFSYYAGWCIWQPQYNASWVRNYPFLSTEDSLEEFKVSLKGDMKRISSSVFGSSMIEDGELARMSGEYVVIAEGNFYNPDYFEKLMKSVHSWTLPKETHKNFESSGECSRRIFGVNDLTHSCFWDKDELFVPDMSVQKSGNSTLMNDAGYPLYKNGLYYSMPRPDLDGSLPRLWGSEQDVLGILAKTTNESIQEATTDINKTEDEECIVQDFQESVKKDTTEANESPGYLASYLPYFVKKVTGVLVRWLFQS